jgi:ABC-2 type transport system ATP-binding protein
MRKPLLLLAGLVTLLAGAPAAAQATDVTVTSFDGTHIVAHWFPVAGASVAAPRPTVMMGPGWGGAGDVDVNGTGSGAVGVPGIKTLHDAGYNVLTWDPRGFGKSGGTVEVDSASVEGRDTQKLIDWLATQPQAKIDTPGDPRVGMAGASYGGGIQLVTAAIDHRVDAIAPSIAWNSQGTSLYKDSTVKTGWSGFLYGVAAGRSLDPHIKSAYTEGLATGVLSKDNADWFLSRGPGALIRKIVAPTLLIQGTVDTLFTLGEAQTNYKILRKNHVPTRLLWFCGGHGACLTDTGDTGRPAAAAVQWFARYLDGKKVATGPRFSGIDQNGRTFSSADYPPKAKKPIAATGKGTLTMSDASVAGPAKIGAGAGGLGSIVAAITPAKATTAVNVKVRARRAALVVGAPTVTLKYRGKIAGPRPARVFGQLVDDKTGLVLGNQITPIPLRLDGRTHTVKRPLEIVSERLKKGQSVTLQLVATTVAYAKPRLGGPVRFASVKVTLPTI